ncbi:MAG: hypothetical protein KAQ71_22105 [Desulfobulbaceae bacterium]|nr:hypothetical protein [Desulfobulbaceae bacterium]
MCPSYFTRKLLSWYAENCSDFPWRRTKDPYHIHVSEIMLQQTQVERVKEYYLRWVEEFPDITTLAPAGEEKVLTRDESLLLTPTRCQQKMITCWCFCASRSRQIQEIVKASFHDLFRS